MKRALSAFSLMLIALLASNSTITTKFYLNEIDFISDQSIPKNKTRLKSHIVADYNEDDVLLRKTFVGKNGDSSKIEIYTYDSLNILISKNVYPRKGQLLQQVLFGMEVKAVDYIEYVYGIDTVKDWTDRFSILDYNELDQLILHAFFDVNAFLYGQAKFQYDSLGYLSKEEWFRQPSGKTIRWWDHYFDPVTQLTRIMEYDSNGVLVNDFRLNPDGTESIFWFTNLKDSMYVNNTDLVFMNESYLEWGKVVWYLTTSSGQYIDSIDYVLPKQFFKKGNYQTNMGLDSALVDSGKYDLVFKGKGRTGYEATQRKILGLNYDISPPIMDVDTKPFINAPMFRFDRSEPLKSAALVWVSLQDNSIVSVELDSMELSLFGNSLFQSINQTSLIDSHYYRIELTGTDRAGNLSVPGYIDSILFDISPPVVEFNSPYRGEYRNFTSSSFNTSEVLQSWKIRMEYMGGDPDPNSPHIFETDSSLFKLTVIENDLGDDFYFNDGTMYRFELSALDRAGNESKPFSVDSVNYDISPPVLSIIYPAVGAAINKTTISFSISEPLRAGEFRWEQTEGTMDSSAPHIITLEAAELRQGDHIQIDLANQDSLTDGSIYTLSFTGIDLAGNHGEAPSNVEILYDAIPPEFTDIDPVSGSAVNHKNVSYKLSEKIVEGSITWTWTGGIKDPSSPHVVKLINDEQNGGVHDSIQLINEPPLVDGGIYQIEYNASDRAGNSAETIIIENVLYDFTVPSISISYPQSLSFLPKANMSYELSEDLEKGLITIERSGGVPDPNAPYKIPLSNTERSRGLHDNVMLVSMPKVVEGTIYKITFMGRDRAMNFTVPVSIPGIQYDFTPPVISIFNLDDSTDVNNKFISYELSEILNNAFVTWKRTGGKPDQTTHRQSLTGTELSEGIHPNMQIANSPNLIDGSVYSISIEGEDRAGNPSNVPMVKDLLYDVTSPVITLGHPDPRTYISKPKIFYELSEKLHKSSIKFEQTGGSVDTLSPHTISMNLSKRTLGSHDVFEDDGPVLTEGSIYTISINGNDRAGNKANTASVSGVIFDATPPILSIQTPDSSLFVNHKIISFSKSEELKSGKIVWEQTGGISDDNSPHSISLMGNELAIGDFIYQLFQTPITLNDGSIYTISFSAIDFAGNVSETIKMENVLYDISPPLIEIVSPENGYFTKGSELSFFQSEELKEGMIFWKGVNQAGALVEDKWILNESSLKKGAHELNNYTNPELVDGGVYTIEFSATDLAGNSAEPVNITEYTVDRTPPVFSSLYPAGESIINLDHIGYSLSEKIESGTILLKTGEEETLVKLVGSEMDEGIKEEAKLLSDPHWYDGGKYQIKFVGIDFAGNVSDTVSVQNVTYDISPPVLSINHPQENLYVNERFMNISVNEELENGQVVWEAPDGSNVAMDLKDDHRLDGEHDLDYDLMLKEMIPYKVYVEGIDLAGNKGISSSVENVIFDKTAPTLDITFPESGTITNQMRVSYTLDEELMSGKMIWQDVSGLDQSMIHEVELKAEELKKGEHQNIILNAIPELVDGASYMLRIEGTDLAGNKNDSSPIEQYTYDASPPVFSELIPVNESLVNKVNIGYTISEDLSEGKLIFTQTGGTDDTNSPHVVNLSGSRLKEGPRGGELPEKLISLQNGSTYTIDFEGVDNAGNRSEKTQITQFSYDNEPPVVFIKSPSVNSHTNSIAMGYLISEDLDEGKIVVTIDKMKNITIDLNELQRKEGEFADQLPPELKELNDGASLDFTLSGSDAAGNYATPHTIENVKYDTTHPIVNIMMPENNDVVNYISQSFTLSEDLKKGELIVTQTGGVLDTRSPQVISLKNRELKSGLFENIELESGTILQNGSIYSFEYSGSDFAGNEVRSNTIQNVLFDNEAPVLTISNPIDSEQIKSTLISYMLSDDLEKGTVTFEAMGGTTDPGSPHVVELSGSQLRKGPLMNVEMDLMDQLSDGARYNVTMHGWDRAGNEADPVSVSDVLFDVNPPILSIHDPLDNSSISEPLISIEMNEKLAEGIITYTHSGGAPDANSPHEIYIISPFNEQGRHDGVSLGNELLLNHGSEYSITFNARDPAGNASAPASVDKILYDVIAPNIQLKSPISDSYLKEMNLLYEVDEKLDVGTIEITQTIGATDPNSPHMIELNGKYLLPGSHEINVSDQVNFVSGAEYIIRISGEDLAGNQTTSNEVDQLIFDIEPPMNVFHAPVPNSMVNHSLIGFTIGETLSKLSVKWVDETGEESVFDVPDRYHIPDQYENVILPDPPLLVSGEKYTIILSAKDMAGNIADISIENITFDDAPPIFKGVSPSDGDFLNHTKVQFSMNEPLQSGRIIWRAVGGNSDNQSPRSVELVGLELETVMEDESLLSNQMELNDGTVYDLSIEGTDLAGNINSAVLSRNLTYDITHPTVKFTSPDHNAFRNNDGVSFTVDEFLSSGYITFNRIMGAMDPSAHVHNLAGSTLNPGTHNNDSYVELPLVSGAQYEIVITGTDLAGNVTETSDTRTIFYDTTPPQITMDSPEENSSINNQLFGFTISEPLVSGDLIFTDQNGQSTSHSLSKDELKALVNFDAPITIPANIVDGTIYSFKLSGADVAGNISESEYRSNIHYDITKPNISISSPSGNGVYIGSNITYSMSEDMILGTATWTREGGKPDPNSPHIINLNSAELAYGDHNDILLASQTKLNVGTIYSLNMTGQDAAKNESIPTVVNSIEQIRSLNGNWFFQGAIMTVVWSFEDDEGGDGSVGTFSQGMQMGTKISNQEYGRYKIDFSTKPWTLSWTMDKSGQSRISIFEFEDENHLRVVTREKKKPKDWADGEVMLYEFR